MKEKNVNKREELAMFKRITLVFCLFYFLSIGSVFAFEVELTDFFYDVFYIETNGDIKKINLIEKEGTPINIDSVPEDNQKAKKPKVFLDVETFITDVNQNPLNEVPFDQAAYLETLIGNIPGATY